MVEKTSRPDKPDPKHWCACDCKSCDLGAHENCTKPECHMPKMERHQEAGLPEALLRPLAELEFKFCRRVDALLHQQSVLRINGCSEAVFARQELNRIRKADEILRRPRSCSTEWLPSPGPSLDCLPSGREVSTTLRASEMQRALFLVQGLHRDSLPLKSHRRPHKACGWPLDCE